MYQETQNDWFIYRFHEGLIAKGVMNEKLAEYLDSRIHLLRLIIPILHSTIHAIIPILHWTIHATTTASTWTSPNAT